ncbi:MAG TPA: hypothetical protein VHN74_13780 [Candidatus Angelobacter sp.]|nr:hypothetical protein [Candidatus Angelobacter sp.]
MSSSAQAAVILGLALEIALVAALLLKRAWRRFPIFTMYASFVLAENAAAFALYRQPRIYLYMYLIGESIAIVLGLGVAYEIFRDLFTAHAALRRMAVTVFQVSTGALFLLAASVLYYQASSGATGFARALNMAEEAARIIEIGAIVFLFIFSGAFGLHWRQSTFGIALGLGLFVATKLAALAILPYTSKGITDFVSMIAGFSFDLSLLIWLGYLLVPEHAPATTELPQPSQLEQWNQAILELIHQ